MMRTFTKLLFVAALFSILAVACQPSNDGDASKDATTTQTGTESTKTKELEAVKVLNANLATEAELNGLGLTPELVTQILEQRPFLTMNTFDALLGAVENKEELYKKIFVPFNLNTTAEDDFKMIPGVGDRMAHEFEEYRPYTSIKQFRKEIGKYVDEAEVARYENFVFVPVELNSASEEDIKALPGVGGRMAHEFEEYRPYSNMEQFRKEIGKYVDDKELSRLERFVYLKK
ncbi:MAG: helix-hairpin-helix domain-containing protein [Bacteroidia bacterium]|nr:helix-hairpin-helix domain-containing protein [Bacteroidia bacterium]